MKTPIQILQALTVFASLCAPTTAWSCIMAFRPAEELKGEAAVVFEATVLAKEVKGRSVSGELYEFRVEVERVERGRAAPGPTTIDYYNLRAHERDGVMHCFSKDGSGLEVDLVKGARYRFFIKSETDKSILFTESIAPGNT